MQLANATDWIVKIVQTARADNVIEMIVGKWKAGDVALDPCHPRRDVFYHGTV